MSRQTPVQFAHLVRESEHIPQPPPPCGPFFQALDLVGGLQEGHVERVGGGGDGADGVQGEEAEAVGGGAERESASLEGKK